MRFSELTYTQAETFAIFAEHFGVSISELQSKEGDDLDATCYELAEKFHESLANNFVYEYIDDLARGFKALAYGGSI